MLKYRGQYRVVNEIDKSGKPCEFTFVPCSIKKGSNICRHSDNVLNLYIPSVKIGNRLLSEYPKIFKLFLQGDEETVLLFAETDMDIVAGIVKARTKGSNISPRSKRNLNLFTKPGLNVS